MVGLTTPTSPLDIETFTAFIIRFKLDIAGVTIAPPGVDTDAKVSIYVNATNEVPLLAGDN